MFNQRLVSDSLNISFFNLFDLYYPSLFFFFDSIFFNNSSALPSPRISFSFSSDFFPSQESSNLLTLSLVSGVKSFIALSMTFLWSLSRSLGLNSAPIIYLMELVNNKAIWIYILAYLSNCFLAVHAFGLWG